MAVIRIWACTIVSWYTVAAVSAVVSREEAVASSSKALSLYLRSVAQKELGVAQMKLLFEQQRQPDRPEQEFVLDQLSSALGSKVKQILNILNEPSANFLQSRALPAESVVRRRFYVANWSSVVIQDPDNNSPATRRSSLFYSTLYSCIRKNVIVMLDRGPDLSVDQLNFGRRLVTHLLNSLGTKDRIALLTLPGGRQVEYATLGPDCYIRSLLEASVAVKKAIVQHLSNVQRHSQIRPDPTSGFEAIAEMLLKTEDQDNRPILSGGNESVLIVFITTDSSMSTDRASQLLSHFVDGLPAVARAHIATDLYYLVAQPQVASADVAGKGPRLIPLHPEDDLVASIGDLFHSISVQCATADEAAAGAKFFAPVGDVISVARSIPGVKAVIGVDTSYRSLFQDLIFQSSASNIHALVVDRMSGNVVFHPNQAVDFALGKVEREAPLEQVLSSASGSAEVHLPADAKKKHRTKLFVWRRVEDSPYVVLVVSTSINDYSLADVHLDLNTEGEDEDKEGVPVSMRLSLPSSPPSSSPSTQGSSSSKLPDVMQVLFHRLDALPQKSKLCQQFSYPASLELGTVYLAPKAYLYPQPALEKLQSSYQTVENFLAYLTDKTLLISNPGVKPGLREDVQTIIQMTSAWKNMTYDSGLNNFIVRRYVATARGAYFVYPGSISSPGFDPNKQDWYLKAITFPDKVILTPPRLDPAGSGYIVTLAQAVWTQNSAHIPAVVGMDLTMGYVYKLVVDTLKYCQDFDFYCFLFDDKGYLVVHPTMFSGKSVFLGESVHLSSREPLMAADIVRQTQFVQKRRCIRQSDKTWHMFYAFNTSFGQVLSSNDLHNCSRYMVSRLHRTNLFIALVNKSCTSDALPAFCPCSIDSSQCMLCAFSRTDDPAADSSSSPCQCPCECPLQEESCAQQPEEICPPNAQPTLPLRMLSPEPSSDPDWWTLLPPCFERQCGWRTSKEHCFGIIGCSWCEKEASGRSHPRPFCGEVSRCHFGTLNARSPYSYESGISYHPAGDRATSGSSGFGTMTHFQDASLVDDPLFFTPTSSSVGPIVGGIVACFVFLALSVFCLRSQGKCSIIEVLAGVSRSGCGSSLQMASLEEDFEIHQPTAGNGHHGEELLELAAVPSGSSMRTMSPYQINPMYRRPPPGTDSDHGYSTMTPVGGDQDSEIIPYTESQSAWDRFRKRPSTTSSSCSPHTMQLLPGAAGLMSVKTALLSEAEESRQTAVVSEETILPEGERHLALGRHQFIVAATVHMESH